jgi:hypothetical protein
MSFSDQVRLRTVVHTGTSARSTYGCRLITRNETVETAGITGLRIVAEAGNALAERPLKPMAKRGRLAQSHKARVSCGYLRSHWRSTLAPSDNPTVRRRRARARECAAFFRSLAQICDDPERSDEAVSEEIRQTASGYAEWAEEYLTREEPNHPLMPVIRTFKDTFFIGLSTADDIPLKIRKARDHALLIAGVLEATVDEPAGFDGQRGGGGGQPGRERRTRASAWIDRY